MKTADITNALLAKWVAMACHLTDRDVLSKWSQKHPEEPPVYVQVGEPGPLPIIANGQCIAKVRGMLKPDVFAPHTELRQIGPLVGRFKMDTEMMYEGEGAPVGIPAPKHRAWIDRKDDGSRAHIQEGNTPGEALCRTIVHSVFGDEVAD